MDVEILQGFDQHLGADVLLLGRYVLILGRIEKVRVFFEQVGGDPERDLGRRVELFATLVVDKTRPEQLRTPEERVLTTEVEVGPKVVTCRVEEDGDPVRVESLQEEDVSTLYR